TNLALHIICSLLLWHVLRLLAVPGPFLAALLFALHPVNVESVAWIAQRKNLLAMLFFLASIACYVRAALIDKTAPTNQTDPGSASRQPIASLLSLLAFLLAMLSKGSVAFLPAVLLLLVWWQCGRITRFDFLRPLPFFTFAAILTAMNIWFQ